MGFWPTVPPHSGSDGHPGGYGNPCPILARRLSTTCCSSGWTIQPTSNDHSQALLALEKSLEQRADAGLCLLLTVSMPCITWQNSRASHPTCALRDAHKYRLTYVIAARPRWRRTMNWQSCSSVTLVARATVAQRPAGAPAVTRHASLPAGHLKVMRCCAFLEARPTPAGCRSRAFIQGGRASCQSNLPFLG
jgi:hypothetical protein